MKKDNYYCTNADNLNARPCSLYDNDCEKCPLGRVDEYNGFKVGELILYKNGESYQIGKIKSISGDKGAFVYYHEGNTASKTSWEHIHKLMNAYCITKTSLGGLGNEESMD